MAAISTRLIALVWALTFSLKHTSGGIKPTGFRTTSATLPSGNELK
ncbi:MAG: hypothetical protein ACXWH0_08635 [Acidimicrobiia bacterium]